MNIPLLRKPPCKLRYGEYRINLQRLCLYLIKILYSLKPPTFCSVNKQEKDLTTYDSLAYTHSRGHIMFAHIHTQPPSTPPPSTIKIRRTHSPEETRGLRENRGEKRSHGRRAQGKGETSEREECLSFAVSTVQPPPPAQNRVSPETAGEGPDVFILVPSFSVYV